jgi:hypothetical protein
VTRRASLVLLGVLCAAFAQPAAAQEYQLNQWHLSLANGQQATVERGRGGSEWGASWELPAPTGGAAITVQAWSSLGRRVATEGQAFLASLHGELRDCRLIEPLPGLRGRRVIVAFCEQVGTATGVIEGRYDGLQVRFSASFTPHPGADHLERDRRWLIPALSSITRLEETRAFDWSDVQCGAFHPTAHPGVPRPTFYCAWDGRNRLTVDNCPEPVHNGPWAGCDHRSYTEATFAEIGADADPLTLYAVGAGAGVSRRSLTLRGLQGRSVRLGVKNTWFPRVAPAAERMRRLRAFLVGATVSADLVVVRP